jgi:hypothetical protein
MRFIFLSLLATTAFAAPQPLFDGKSFDGWQGDTAKTWRIVDGAFVGGSLEEKVPHNEFLATTKKFYNFELTLKFKLLGSEGFVNGGVQFRSVHAEKPDFEMVGYQADLGGPNYFGCLYDESRRKKMLVQADADKVNAVLKKDDWNDYRIRCEGPHIQIWLNGVQTVDYTEEDGTIAAVDGYIAVQVHGNGKTEAWYKDIAIEELPAK